MRRREVITLLGGAVVGWPLFARTEEARRLYRLGVLHQLPRGLRREGFIEGRNLVIDSRGLYSRSDQYQDRAAQIVNSGVDVLICGGDATIRAAQQVTQTVPIVGIADDMVASGLMASYRHYACALLNHSKCRAGLGLRGR
jgi:putative ABC transport system substrate-binding protein